tara:strand:+ start:776 stop:1042 length:267 start_codon:yes stop_codon:yes gene_type:complete
MSNQNSSHLDKPLQALPFLPYQGMSRARDILPYLPFGRTTLHEWSQDGRFPASIKLSPTIVAWRNAEVLKWLESQNSNPSDSQEETND